MDLATGRTNDNRCASLLCISGHWTARRSAMVSRAICIAFCFIVALVACILIVPVYLVGRCYGTRHADRYKLDWHIRTAT